MAQITINKDNVLFFFFSMLSILSFAFAFFILFFADVFGWIDIEKAFMTTLLICFASGLIGAISYNRELTINN